MKNFTPGQIQISFVRRIGGGGIGTVDEVEVVESSGAPAVGTRFARKQLGPPLAQDPTMRGRFERELELLQRMDHPNIVSHVGASVSGTGRYYAMPLYAHSLRARIDREQKPWSPIEVTRLGIVLADALAYAHGAGFVHGDLKPENILLQGDDVVIADWGIGQFVHKGSKVLSPTADGLGTAYYCSAEQWAPDGECDARVDIYSLGVLLAELAYGDQVPILPIGAGIRVNMVMPTTRDGQTFNGIIQKMTGVVPAMRYPTMADVAQALRSVG
jgi:serine/threonine protein kinase